MFKSKFIEWPPTPDLKLSSEDGRGKVAGYCLHIMSSLNLIYIHIYYQFRCKILIKRDITLLSTISHAALLKSQGLDVKGLMKVAPVKEELQPYIDCTGHLQVLSFPTCIVLLCKVLSIFLLVLGLFRFHLKPSPAFLKQKALLFFASYPMFHSKSFQLSSRVNTFHV
jgi:hypothetical protein